MDRHVVRLVSVLALITACPLDPGEGTSTTGNETGDDTSSGSPTTNVTVTTSSPSTSSPSTTDMATTSSPSTTSPDTETSATETVTETTDATESGSSSTGIGEVVPATIPEIRQGDVAEDTAVEITDAIVTAVADGNGFFMQDAAGGEYSGIWVYTGEEGPFPVLGDVVTVVGVYTEFYDLSQIGTGGGGSVEVTASPGEGNVPAPELLAVGDLGESWESVFVRVADDTFTVMELSDVMDVNEFRVEDGAGDSVWVDDFMYDVVDAGDLAGFDVGASFDAIQGPLNFTFDEFKITPRSLDDLSNYMAP